MRRSTGMAEAFCGSRKVVVVDLGDRVVIRPLGDEPIGDLDGKYRGCGPSTDRSRKEARAEDASLRPLALTILTTHDAESHAPIAPACPAWDPGFRGLTPGKSAGATLSGVGPRMADPEGNAFCVA